MTQTQPDDVRLRPLTIGEIFDRSLTLFVRNLPPFLIVAAFVAVPSGFLQYALVAGHGSFMQQIASESKGNLPAVFGFGPAFWFGAFGVLLVQPFMYVAMASLVGRIYRGETRDWRAAYMVALRHAGGILVTVLCAIGIYVGSGIAFGIVAVIVSIPFAVASPAASAILIFLLMIPYIFLLLVAFLAIALAFNAIGIDELGFGRAIGQGFASVFSRGQFKKAVLIVLAFIAVEIGLGAVGIGIQAFTASVPVLEAALSAALSLFSTGFFGVLIAVYYFDVRVRREGLDLQAALDAIQPPARQ
ncbi:MAG TPA: hypothetical protein VFL13_01850 [Candidatus Baltobacteraceae bacterium]|nr:hypothetical protein [Candidatus Baltobacteraceae bacterium]